MVRILGRIKIVRRNTFWKLYVYRINSTHSLGLSILPYARLFKIFTTYIFMLLFANLGDQ